MNATAAPDAPATLPDHVRVAIIGSGFSGLGMAIRLKQSGEDSFAVLERGPGVGGTWRDNDYPGAACDVPSRLYSFSFAPNPDWTRSFSPQPEILSYLRGCAERFGVADHLHTDCRVDKARWNGEVNRWHIETTRGELTADVLVSAAGALSEPKNPEIPGLENFTGATFHSAAWNHDQDLAGKRVAVIGTGASAVQIVPKIQPIAEHLTVFQRTPAWIIPRTDRPFTRVERAVYSRFPRVERLARAAIFWGRETYVLGFTRAQGLMRVTDRIARSHLERQVPDPELRAKLTPEYRIGCKRILISNDFYPSLSQTNADVVTEPITEVRERAVVTADGVEHPTDAIVIATGFQVTPPPIAEAIHGRDGRALSEVWDKQGMQAHRGTTVAGFPNMFMLVGPNTGLGHTSMVYVIEAQVQYVMEALRAMVTKGVATVEPRREVQDRFNATIKRQLDSSIWQTGGCGSWYLDQHGNNVTLWPDFTFRFKALTESFDAENYELERVEPCAAAEPVGASV